MSKRPTSVAERLLLLERQVDDVLTRLVGSTNEPTEGPARAPYLGPAIPESLQHAIWQAGFDTPDKIREADDEELLAIPGVGRATLSRIREAVGH